MTGAVNDDLEPIVRITVRGPTGRQRRLRAVVDTGFNGALSLPAYVIEELNLPWARRGFAELADGKITEYDVYWAVVYWNRRCKRIHVDEAGTTALIGMELMRGSRMKLDILEGGMVTIKPLGRRGGRR